MLSSYRKKDLKSKIHTLGFFKGMFTCALDLVAIRTQNDKWENPVHNIYMDFLQKKYWNTGLYKSNVIDELTFGKNIQSERTNIWIFWYQGWDSAPQIVKDCRCATEKYIDNEIYSVHYLTKDNYASYVKFPEWIMEKVAVGTINLTEFSNMVRSALLYQFGGIWMDATILLTEPLDEKIMDYPYYTIKRLPEHPMYCIARHQWSTFFLTANQCRTRFYQELLTLQIEYWRREDYIFDYFMFDYFIALILRHHPDISKEWEMIPLNNTESTVLEHILNERYDPTCWEKLKAENSMFKVTYKIQLSEDPDTYYNRIVNSKTI